MPAPHSRLDDHRVLVQVADLLAAQVPSQVSLNRYSGVVPPQAKPHLEPLHAALDGGSSGVQLALAHVEALPSGLDLGGRPILDHCQGGGVLCVLLPSFPRPLNALCCDGLHEPAHLGLPCSMAFSGPLPPRCSLRPVLRPRGFSNTLVCHQVSAIGLAAGPRGRLVKHQGRQVIDVTPIGSLPGGLHRLLEPGIVSKLETSASPCARWGSCRGNE
mmetsp:Transcript_98904/g.264486  ORF Transcript_98904/g.264486 Transcript_98904/m.264486 type:complete len:216 (+) Transcript_98904:1109-1756(+)